MIHRWMDACTLLSMTSMDHTHNLPLGIAQPITAHHVDINSISYRYIQHIKFHPVQSFIATLPSLASIVQLSILSTTSARKHHVGAHSRAPLLEYREHAKVESTRYVFGAGIVSFAF